MMTAIRWFAFVGVLALVVASGTVEAQGRVRREMPPVHGVSVGEFGAEVAHKYTTQQGLPSDNVLSIVVSGSGRVLAGTDRGVALFDGEKWQQVSDYAGSLPAMAVDGEGMIAITEEGLFHAEQGDVEKLADLPLMNGKPVTVTCVVGGARRLVGTDEGLFELQDGSLVPNSKWNVSLGWGAGVRQIAVAADGRIVIAAEGGLFLLDESGIGQPFLPQGGGRSWAPRDVRGVAFDGKGQLWFCEPQGVGVRHTNDPDQDQWKLSTAADGLPYADFTTAAGKADGSVIFGTNDGAIRFDGETWEYRRGPRWLPNNEIRAIAIGSDGREWYATAGGVGCIERRPMTLAKKAEFLEDEIDKYHRRTPYEFVLEVRLKNVGDKSEWTQQDSDNDGLWTAMYGAGECFAYAATKNPLAKERATKAFQALKFLSEVTQGGSNPAPPGFPARTILPTSGPNPNTEHYTPERDREAQQRDPLWKVISPRWPTSADGKWYWKCDTSSDELDGHFFLYALYHDLVAETDEEKQSARDVITRIVDHLIDHKYNLVDHDGLPTRWGRFDPAEFNHDLRWSEGRGLNSMCMLSYLKVAEHVSGDQKYREAYDDLVVNHGYAVNTMVPKMQFGPGTGNHSDDEMAFMSFYNLIRYEADPERKKFFAFAFYRYWLVESPELNPLFNFLFAATTQDAFADGGARGRFGTGAVPQSAIDEGVDTLVRYPLDRIRWPFKNSHRLDIERLPQFPGDDRNNGRRRNGSVIPIDERSVEHWNHNPWELDEEGHDGRTLTDGTAFLLPYYLGLYRGYVVE